MALIKLQTPINAPAHICFDLSRNIDLHTAGMQKYMEKAIAGVTSGLIQLNETVTWQAKHFGFNLRHTSIISAMEYPLFFIDEMLEGHFKAMRHVHKFHQKNGFTLMEDEFMFRSPAGILGCFVDAVLLKAYLKNLLLQRNQLIKEKAEEIYKKNEQPH